MKHIELYEDFINENRKPNYKYLVQILMKKKPADKIHWDNNSFMLSIGTGVKLRKESLPEYFDEPRNMSSDIQAALLLAHKNPDETVKQVKKLSKGQIEVTIYDSPWVRENGGAWVQYQFVG